MRPRKLEEFTDPNDPSVQLYEEAVRIYSKKTSGGNSGTGSTLLNTIDLPVPRGIRVMHWNLQDLGGGPSRGIQRDDETIANIAKLIKQCDPDVLCILEVKDLCPKPKPPTGVAVSDRFTRGGASAIKQRESETDTQLKKKAARYKKDLENYEKWAKSSKEPTGFLELNRLAKLLPAWELIKFPTDKKDIFSEGEAYGYFLRVGLFDKATYRLCNEAKLPTLRAPALATLEFNEKSWPHTLNIVGFHAPAPSHGDLVRDALKELKQLAFSEYVLASDTNLDTASLKWEEKVEALSVIESSVPSGVSIDSTRVKLRFKAVFQNYITMVEEVREYQGEFEAAGFGFDPFEKIYPYSGTYQPSALNANEEELIGKLVKLMPGDQATTEFFSDLPKKLTEPSMSDFIADDPTSLRKSKATAEKDRKKMKSDPVGELENFKAYDKLIHVLCGFYNYFEPLSEAIHVSQVRFLTGGKLKALTQTVLDDANDMSDHDPLVLDLLLRVTGEDFNLKSPSASKKKDDTYLEFLAEVSKPAPKKPKKTNSPVVDPEDPTDGDWEESEGSGDGEDEY